MTKKFEIRNSTMEFLTFVAEGKEEGIQVMYADETIWCTQDAIAMLFDKGRSTIAEHIANIFKEGELKKEAVCRNFRRTANDGKTYSTQFYNLDAIISVGYRVNSRRATQFRQWSTCILRQFAIRGYVVDKKRMENGQFLMATDREILQNAGRITAEYAKEYAETEFEKYRVIQDRLFTSDFDKMIAEGDK